MKFQKRNCARHSLLKPLNHMEVIKLLLHLSPECGFLLCSISCETLKCELSNELKLSKLQTSILNLVSSKSGKYIIKTENTGENVGRKGLSATVATM